MHYSSAKVVIIGCGMVGASAAYACMIQGRATEIVLIDIDEKRRDGEVMDLSHGSQYTETHHIRSGTYEDCTGADVIVFAAGANQKPGETRLDLAGKNIKILESVCRQMKPYLSPHTIILMVSNPVDILTYVCQKLLPKQNPNTIIGSGTSLDTSRFRYYLGQHFGVSPRSVHAYIIGEHGDSELAAWSTANISGVPLKKYKGYNARAMKKIFESTKKAAYEIIQRKGSTYYAIGIIVAELLEIILNNQKMVIPLSVHPRGMHGLKDLCIGLPAVLGRNGIKQVIPITLSSTEKKALLASAKKLKALIRQHGY